MKRINVKGVIVFDDYKEVYDWFGIENTSISDVVNELPTDGSPVEVIINSPGGHVDAGSEIYTHLKAYDGEVHTKIYAMAASAASLVAMGGKTSIAPTGQIMIHNVSGGIDGDYRALHKEAEVLEKYNHAIANAYMLKTGKSQEEILEMMNKETYMTAQEAIEWGFADEIMFDAETPKVATMTASLLPKEAVDKARQMIKENKGETAPTTAPNVDEKNSKLTISEDQITNIINRLSERIAEAIPKEPEQKPVAKQNLSRLFLNL